MRKVLFALFAVGLLAQAVLAANEVYWRDTATVRNQPYGVKVYDLHTRNTASSADTLATTVNNVYGPYELCNDGDILPTKFIVQGDVITGTTPTMSVDYQLIGGKSITDTLAVWTAADTLGTTATNQQVTISGAGTAIMFRVHNYDGTASQIPGLLRIIIPSGVTTMLRR